MSPGIVTCDVPKKGLSAEHICTLNKFCTIAALKANPNIDYHGVLFYGPTRMAYIRTFIDPVRVISNRLILIAKENPNATFEITMGFWMGGICHGSADIRVRESKGFNAHIWLQYFPNKATIHSNNERLYAGPLNGITPAVIKLAEEILNFMP